jgi:hypothetical protein
MPIENELYLFLNDDIFLTTRVRRAIYHAYYKYSLLIYE